MKKDLKEALNNNFANMDLRGWSFKGQNLTGANFEGADLEGVCFIDTVLVSANFEGANLKNTDFSCANAWSANFNETNLTGASFEGADLDGASFAQANLTEANLQDTNIITAEFDNTIGIYPVCPTAGSFIGWTIGEDFKGNECLLEIFIPTWARRSSGTTRKCRTEALVVKSVERLKDGCNLVKASLRFRNHILSKNEFTQDSDFEVDRFKVSSTDLYFWISKEEALAQARKRI